MPRVFRWIPPAILCGGCLLLVAARQQNTVTLRGSLATLPIAFSDYLGSEVTVSAPERRIAGMDSYVMRLFALDSLQRFSLYVGYYEAQLQGRSIHSPKNCLPGAGWEPVDVGTAELLLENGPVTVNRYVLEQEQTRALVYYWYQGRGRVAFNEYHVKWDLLRDKALHGRSEEALVRIVVPMTSGVGSESTADSIATAVSQQLIPALRDILPAFP